MEYVVYPAVRKQKVAGSANREERVRMSIYNELIETYGYPVGFPRKSGHPVYAALVFSRFS